MHHVHFQAGQSIAAADYQAHLDRMKAIAQAREQEQTTKRTRDKAFQGYIDADEESAGQQAGAGGDEQPNYGEAEATGEGGEEPDPGATRYA